MRKLFKKTLEIKVKKDSLARIESYLENNLTKLLFLVLSLVSISYFLNYYKNGLGLSYNDARSHLDIARRVVEGLKPGFAQLGSVWLPLPHILMLPTIWNDFFWHSGLSGSLVSMVSFVITGILIYLFLKELGVKIISRLFGVLVFAANLNILYLQSTAMTELLLLATMTAGAYYFLLYYKRDNILDLIKSAFFIMLSTLVRYDGWFLLFFAGVLIIFSIWRERGYKVAEGIFLLFVTLGGFGIFLWVLWNLIIFKDPFYFAFGEFSARAQQAQLEVAGDLPTKGNLFLSIKIYLYALIYNSYAYATFLGIAGAFSLWFSKKVSSRYKIATLLLTGPFIFNVLALYAGHSVLFIQGISGNTWFNIRYGMLLAPSLAIFSGYLMHRLSGLKWVILGLFGFTIFFAFINQDSVALDDARVGSSQKNVSEVSGWLKNNTGNKEGFILISAASHDAIIFSSGLPMKRFIHEGTGAYWESATTAPDRWARWIVMRTYDKKDLTYKFVSETDALKKYNLVDSYPFADIYELKFEYLKDLHTTPIFGKQK